MRSFRTIRICVILSATLASVAFAQDTSIPSPQERFLGEWVNIDPAAGGVTKLNVYKDGDSWMIQGWGKCQPTDCDWEKVTLNLVGSSIGDKSFEYGFAIWDFEHKSTYLTMKLDGNQLIIEIIDIYHDESNRSNKRKLYLLRRAVK